MHFSRQNNKIPEHKIRLAAEENTITRARSKSILPISKITTVRADVKATNNDDGVHSKECTRNHGLLETYQA